MRRTRITAYVVATAITAGTAALASADPSFDLSWYTIDAGGGTSTGGVFALSGTIAQADADSMSGGNVRLDGGFWMALGGAPCPCDCAVPPDGVVNVVDFLALLADWGGAGPCDCADPSDGVVNVVDFLAMLGAWGPCP